MRSAALGSPAPGRGTRARIPMRTSFAFALLALVPVAVAAAAFSGTGAAHPRAVTYRLKTIRGGLSNPRGLAMNSRGAIYVAEAGRGGSGACATMRGQHMCYGPTGSVARIWRGQFTRVARRLPSFAPQGGSGAVGPHMLCFDPEGRLLVTYGLGMDPSMRSTLGSPWARSGYLMHVTKRGAAQPVADVSAYESAHNPAGGPVDSNPYAVHCLRGSELVTDAGGNDLFRVKKRRLSLLAVFPSRPARSTDSVPTSVAVGPDHAYYVGELTGKPFDVGAADVYRVRPGKQPQVYLSGFTAIIDMRFDRQGNLYVLEHATGPGLSGPGALIKVSPPGTRTTVVDGLSQPTAVLIGHHGAIYVTDNGTSPTDGRLLRVLH